MMEVCVLLRKVCSVLVVSTLIQCVSGQCSSAPPTINNASTNIQGSPPYAEGTQAIYSCPAGYNIEGTFGTECSEGNWTTPTFQCVQIFCPLFGPPVNGRIVDNTDYSVGSIIEFACDVGFDISGQATFSCGTDGAWSPTNLPTCTAKNCGTLAPIANAETFQPTSEHGENRYGSEVRVTCNNGFILNGSPTVRCGSDGSWTTSPTCDAITCPPYPGLNSSCIEDTLFSSNNLYITCLTGPEYSVTQTGGTSAFCSASGWSDTEIACYCDCKMATDNNAAYMGLNLKGFLTHDTELVWTCNQGYEKTLQEAVKCLDGNLFLTPSGTLFANQSALCTVKETTTQDTNTTQDRNGSRSNSASPLTTTINVSVLVVYLFILRNDYIYTLCKNFNY